MKSLLKNKYCLLILIAGLFLTIGVNAASLYYANQISYTSSNDNSIKTVEDALNSLYERTTNASSVKDLLNLIGNEIPFTNIENKDISSLSCKYNGKDIETTNQLLNEAVKKDYLLNCNINGSDISLTLVLEKLYIYYGGKFYNDDLTGGYTTSNVGNATGTYTTDGIITLNSNTTYDCFGIRSVNKMDFTNVEAIGANVVTYNSTNRYVSLLISKTLPLQDNTDVTGSLIRSTGNVRLDTSSIDGDNYFGIMLGTNNGSGATLDSLWFELK